MNTTNLMIRLTNTNHPHNSKNAKQLINQTAKNAIFLHATHHLNVLNNQQNLNHLLWMVEHDNNYIGWAALEVSLSEHQEGAYISLMPTALYIKEAHRNQGIVIQLIKIAARDAVRLTAKELMYQSFDEFRLYRGDDAEVLDLNLEIKHREESEENLAHMLNRAVVHELEILIENLPYFMREELTF